MATESFNFEDRDGYKLVYARRIWHKAKGCYIYPKNAKFFRFWVKEK